MGKTVVNSKSAQAQARSHQFWNTVMRNKDSHQGYKYAYEMAKNHYHGGGSSWESGAGAKAQTAFNEWSKADTARKEAERHGKAVSQARIQAQSQMVADTEAKKLISQKKLIEANEKMKLMQEAKKNARRMASVAQLGITTRPRVKRVKVQTKRSSSGRPSPKKRRARPQTFDDTLRHLY